MIIPEDFSESLLFSTCPIKAEFPDGSLNIGTGFHYRSVGDTGYEDYLVTSRHILEGAEALRARFHEAELIDERYQPGNSNHWARQDHLNDIAIFHDDKDVDLAAIKLDPLVEAVEEEHGVDVYSGFIGSMHVLTEVQLTEMHVFEDIIMIGYPEGYQDELNNLPLVRRGVTSSPPRIDFNGKPTICSDIASFRGSSGSPVFLRNATHFAVNKWGATFMQAEAPLLGVLSQNIEPFIGCTMIRGEGAAEEHEDIRLRGIPINMGVIVKAYKLFEMI